MCNVAFLQMAQVAIGTAGQYTRSQAVQRNALAAQSDAFAGLKTQQMQINAQATDQMADRSKQAMREQGTLQAIFADSGVAGNSQDRIVAESARSAAADQTSLERNRQAKIQQTEAEGSAIASRTQATINSAPRPSLIGAGLQIAALGAEDYAKRNPPRPSPSGKS